MPPTLLHLPPHRPLVIAHRGDSAHAPENTLPAFERAIKAGAPMLETALVLSKDRHILLFHDEYLDRTTNGKGRPKDFTLQELQQLDAGSWFAPEFKGTSIPTLAQLLDLAQGRVLLNLEIKPEAYEPGEPLDSIAKQTVAMVKERGLSGQVLISSFEPLVLLECAVLSGCPALGLLVERKFTPGHLDLCRKIKAFSINLPAGARENDIQRIRKAGLQVFVYTVNDPREMHSLYAVGVSGVFTDDPAPLLRSLGVS